MSKDKIIQLIKTVFTNSTEKLPAMSSGSLTVMSRRYSSATENNQSTNPVLKARSNTDYATRGAGIGFVSAIRNSILPEKKEDKIIYTIRINALKEDCSIIFKKLDKLISGNKNLFVVSPNDTSHYVYKHEFALFQKYKEFDFNKNIDRLLDLDEKRKNNTLNIEEKNEAYKLIGKLAYLYNCTKLFNELIIGYNYYIKEKPEYHNDNDIRANINYLNDISKSFKDFNFKISSIMAYSRDEFGYLYTLKNENLPENCINDLEYFIKNENLSFLGKVIKPIANTIISAVENKEYNILEKYLFDLKFKAKLYDVILLKVTSSEELRSLGKEKTALNKFFKIIENLIEKNTDFKPKKQYISNNNRAIINVSDKVNKQNEIESIENHFKYLINYYNDILHKSAVNYNLDCCKDYQFVKENLASINQDLKSIRELTTEKEARILNFFNDHYPTIKPTIQQLLNDISNHVEKYYDNYKIINNIHGIQIGTGGQTFGALANRDTYKGFEGVPSELNKDINHRAHNITLGNNLVESLADWTSKFSDNKKISDDEKARDR